MKKTTFLLIMMKRIMLLVAKFFLIMMMISLFLFQILGKELLLKTLPLALKLLVFFKIYLIENWGMIVLL